MDDLFHAAAGALLASSLGVRRPRVLLAAAVVGVLPDVLWCHNLLLPRSFTHNLLLAVAAFAVIAVFDWRVALAWPLHILVDLPIHKSSELYQWLHAPGINWWQGYGLFAWAALWAVLICLIVLHVRHLRRRRMATATAPADG